MKISEAIELLKKNIIDQARFYLENADEFYPFGASIDNKDNLRPVSFYIEEENPSTFEVLKKLETSLKARIENRESQYAALGLNVYINTNTSDEKAKKNALEVRFFSKEINPKKFYYFYYKNKGNYFFEESLDSL
jgi:hypothetical protein